MIGICPLASGSKGNSVYLGTKESKILIDAGLSYLQLCNRLNEIDVDISEIDAILITHEHMDHIQALKQIALKTEIPILCNSETARGIYNNLQQMSKFKIFTTSEEFEFNDLRIFPFSIQHDTLDPVGFIIRTNGLKLGFCTDFGFTTSLIKKSLENCDYLYIEANHHVSMVHSSNRSYVYKNRVLGRQGHSSNEETLNLLQTLITPKLKHLYLAHLSEECNSEELIFDLVDKLLKEKYSNAKLSIAYQKKISDRAFF